MKTFVAFLMLCLTQVAFAQETASKAEAAYSKACEQLHEAAEKENDVGSAIIAYRIADESFVKAAKLDPDYEPQNIASLRKTIADSIQRLEQEKPTVTQIIMSKPSLTSVIISQGESILISLLIAGVVTNYYRSRRYSANDKYHTFWPRFWTGSIDACVLWPVSVIAAIFDTMHLPAVAAVLVLLIPNLTYWCYTITMHAKYGQTVGKMYCKVKVVDARTEKAITFRQALLREGIPILADFGIIGHQVYYVWTSRLTPALPGLDSALPAFWIATALPSFWFLVEVITMLTNDKRRALHDLIAGTVVVRTNTDEIVGEQTVEIEKGPVAGASYDY